MKLSRTLLLTAAAFVMTAGALALTSHSPRAADALNKEEVQAIVRDYLKEHPEVVMEAIEAYQANQQEIEARMFEKTLADKKDVIAGADLPYAGNPDGDVVIVEFFDYNCGYCKRAMGDINQLLEKDPNVKIVFHEFPILSQSSHDAARYALAAHKQGRYFDYHQAIMKMGGTKSPDNLEKEAEKLGLDLAKLRADANSKEVRQELEESAALGRELGIRGTPAFIIGDTMAPGYMTYQSMQQVIDQVRNDKG